VGVLADMIIASRGDRDRPDVVRDRRDRRRQIFAREHGGPSLAEDARFLTADLLERAA
jgi:hypothetical protein